MLSASSLRQPCAFGLATLPQRAFGQRAVLYHRGDLGANVRLDQSATTRDMKALQASPTCRAFFYQGFCSELSFVIVT